MVSIPPAQLIAHQAIFSTLICLSGILLILELVDGLRVMIFFFWCYNAISNTLSLPSIWSNFPPSSVGAFPEFDGQTFLRDVSSVLVPSPP